MNLYWWYLRGRAASGHDRQRGPQSARGAVQRGFRMLRGRCAPQRTPDRQRARPAGAGCVAPRLRAAALRVAHPGGRLQTTAKTVPPPEPSGAMGMGVSQFVNEPHTCTCERGASRAALPSAPATGAAAGRPKQCRLGALAAGPRRDTRLPTAIGPHEARRHQLAGGRAGLHYIAPAAGPRTGSAARRTAGVPRTRGRCSPRRCAGDRRTSRKAQRPGSGAGL